MSGSLQIERLQEQMGRLKLVRTAAELPLLLQEASKRELSYTELLEEVFSRELAAKQERHTAMKTTMARFPFQKSLESFDFKFQPSIDADSDESDHPFRSKATTRRSEATSGGSC